MLTMESEGICAGNKFELAVESRYDGNGESGTRGRGPSGYMSAGSGRCSAVG